MRLPRPAFPTAALFAVIPAALAAPGCASDGDRLARIEERLTAIDARLARIDELTKPRLFIPTVTAPWPGPQFHVVTRWDDDGNLQLDRAPASWWAILDDGGCVLPRRTGSATIRRLELRLDPQPTSSGILRIDVPHAAEEPAQPLEPPRPEPPPEPR